RQAWNRQPRERETGDVDVLNRSARVAQLVERRLRDELESDGAQFFENLAERHSFLPGKLFEIRQREARYRDTLRRRCDFSHARKRGGAIRGHAGNAYFARAT